MRMLPPAATCFLLPLLFLSSAHAKTHTISWGFNLEEATTNIEVGDSVVWVWDQVRCLLAHRQQRGPVAWQPRG